MTVLPEQSGGQNSAYRSGCHKSNSTTPTDTNRRTDNIQGL
jgi:hypothetical protein